MTILGVILRGQPAPTPKVDLQHRNHPETLKQRVEACLGHFASYEQNREYRANLARNLVLADDFGTSI